MTRVALAGAALVAFVLAGCEQKTEGPHPSPATTTSAAVSASPSASASAPPAASATASAAPGSANAAASGTFKGAYKAKVGAVTPPKDAKVKIWSDDKGDKQVGDGTVTLTITNGVVHGEAKGALGEQTITGMLDGSDLRARIEPKDPNAADAMTGVLQGKVEGSAIVCTLRAASRDANRVREAEIKLAKE